MTCIEVMILILLSIAAILTFIYLIYVALAGILIVIKKLRKYSTNKTAPQNVFEE